MADITTTKETYRWQFKLKRDNDTEERSITLDQIKPNDAGLSAAKAFRDMCVGSTSSPLTVIDPTNFIQPTGWRDNDPNEEPWQTVACTLSKIEENVTTYEGGEGGGGTPSTIELDYDPDEDLLTITYQGSSTPKVYNSAGTAMTVEASTVSGYYFVRNIPTGTTYFVFTAPDGTYEAASATITI